MGGKSVVMITRFHMRVMDVNEPGWRINASARWLIDKRASLDHTGTRNFNVNSPPSVSFTVMRTWPFHGFPVSCVSIGATEALRGG